MSVRRPRSRERLLGGRLLRLLLRAARAGAERHAGHERLAGEQPIVRRPLHLHDVVRHLPPVLRGLLLETRLEVDRRVESLLDLPLEGRDDRPGRGVETVLEDDRRDGRLDERREDVVRPTEVVRELELLGEHPVEPDLSRHRRTAAPGDDRRAQPRQLPLGRVGIAVEQLARDEQPEDAVPEKLQTLVRLRPVGHPRGVHEHLRQALRRERRDQLGERPGRDGPVTGAR